MINNMIFSMSLNMLKVYADLIDKDNNYEITTLNLIGQCLSFSAE